MGMNTSDIVIIGAGVQGASLAFHIAQRGVTVLVLERHFLAAGATGRSSGLVRMYYEQETEARLAWESFQYFRNWPEMVGGECGFIRTGFIHIGVPEKGSQLQECVARHQRIGIPTFVVTSEDVRRLAPALLVHDFEIAAFEPESGYADPHATTKSLMDAARRRGARLVQDCTVVGIKTSKGKVIGVETSKGEYYASVVVNAAGPWAPHIASMVGLRLPIDTIRHDVMVIRRPPQLSLMHPTVIDDINTMYFRPEAGRLTLLGLDDVNTFGESPDGSTERVSPGFVDQAVERICRRVPLMDNGSLQSTYCGYEGISVDVTAILDLAGPEGFYLDCGFSGTGFKTAPAIGRCMAELILDGKPKTVDLSPYSWKRFEGGRLRELLESDVAFRFV